MISPRTFNHWSLRNLCALCVSALSFCLVFYADSISKVHAKQESTPVRGQSPEEAARKSSGCISCHTSTDEPTMHPTKTVFLGCTDCHGGNSSISINTGTAPNSLEYKVAKEKAHVQPRDPIFKDRSALPERTYTKWLKESPEYIRFANPGDLRVAPETCGETGCHAQEVRAVSTSMMTHTGLLWGAALYNNGGYPYKDTHFGESYDRNGQPQSIKTFPPPTPEQTRTKGVLPELRAPLPLGNFAAWKYPSRFRTRRQKQGRARQSRSRRRRRQPDDKLGDRGFGTQLRTDPVFLGLQKTRLVDPIMSFPGTNDQPGDYRASGCTACHVIYANDRDPDHSAWASKVGHCGIRPLSDPHDS